MPSKPPTRSLQKRILQNPVFGSVSLCLEQSIAKFTCKSTPYKIQRNAYALEFTRRHSEEGKPAARLEVDAHDAEWPRCIQNRRLRLRPHQRTACALIFVQMKNEFHASRWKHPLSRVPRAVSLVDPEQLDVIGERRRRNVVAERHGLCVDRHCESKTQIGPRVNQRPEVWLAGMS